MSENFPFDTADEFLNATKQEMPRMSDEVTALPDVAIHVPTMPDRTPVQSGARTAQVGILGIAAFTQDKWVLLAAVIGCAGIEMMRIYCDMYLRSSRNNRIGEENVAAMQCAANIKSTALENQ